MKYYYIFHMYLKKLVRYKKYNSELLRGCQDLTPLKQNHPDISCTEEKPIWHYPKLEKPTLAQRHWYVQGKILWYVQGTNIVIMGLLKLFIIYFHFPQWPMPFSCFWRVLIQGSQCSIALKVHKIGTNIWLHCFHLLSQ